MHARLPVSLLFSFLLIAALAAAQTLVLGAAPAVDLPPSFEFDLVGQAGGSMAYLDVAGDYAYVATRKSLVVVDVRTPDAPRYVGRSPTFAGGLGVVRAADGMLYIAANGGTLQVIDGHDPALLALRGAYDTGEIIQDIEVVDGIAYVTSREWTVYNPYLPSSTLTIIDVTNPDAPLVLGTHTLAYNARRMVVVNGLAYLANNVGFTILDVRDPLQPQQLGQYRNNRESYDLAVAGQTVYLTRYYFSYVLEIIDVSDPAAPVLLGTFGRGERVAVVDSFAYLLDNTHLYVVDVGNPAAPLLRGQYFYNGSASAVQMRVPAGVNPRLAYVAQSTFGLQILDLSDPGRPWERSLFAGGTPADVELIEDGSAGTVSTVSGDDTLGLLQIYDSHEASFPQLLGSLDTLDKILRVRVVGSTAYLAAYARGVLTVDIADPQHPRQLAEFVTPGYVVDLTVRDGLVYAVAQDRYTLPSPGTWNGGGLYIIDVSDPANPLRLGYIHTPGHAKSLSLTGHVALIAAADGGLQIVDVSNPQAPQRLSQYFNPDHAGTHDGLALLGERAYLMLNLSHSQILEVVDLHNVMLPTQRTQVRLTGAYGACANPTIADDLLWLTCGRYLRVFSLSDPDLPQPAGDYQAAGTIKGLRVQGDLIHLAAGTGGYEIVRLREGPPATATPAPSPTPTPSPTPDPAPFRDVAVNLPSAEDAHVAWGDYDSDDDLDLLLCAHIGSQLVSRIYRYDGAGTFVDLNAGLPGYQYGKWGDYDNDGDLDLLLADTTASRVYRNDLGAFVPSGGPLPGVLSQYLADIGGWGDFDNDGDLDILLNGMEATRVFRNESGSFVEQTSSLPPAYDAAWGDMDNDGALDIVLLNGSTLQVYSYADGAFGLISSAQLSGSYRALDLGDYDSDGDLDVLVTRDGSFLGARIYRNSQGGFREIALPTPYLHEGTGAWGDFDNDGDLDVVLNGRAGQYPATTVTQVYVNQGDYFELLNAPLVGVIGNGIAWGDFDNDGDLDLLAAGSETHLYRNNGRTINTAPQAPVYLSAAVQGSRADLHWTAMADDHTPWQGLTYNLRVGTVPGGSNIVSPMSGSNGYRQVPALGNLQHGRTAWLDSLLPGTYYWSVQAVDSAFVGSVFAPEQTFTVGMPTAVTLTSFEAARQESSVPVWLVRGVMLAAVVWYIVVLLGQRRRLPEEPATREPDSDREPLPGVPRR